MSTHYVGVDWSSGAWIAVVYSSESSSPDVGVFDEITRIWEEYGESAKHIIVDVPIGLCEHSCPACGFEADRDANAAWNILARGLEDVGVVHSEATPVETALPVDTPVSAKRVVEAGSPTLKERTASAVSE